MNNVTTTEKLENLVKELKVLDPNVKTELIRDVFWVDGTLSRFVVARLAREAGLEDLLLSVTWR